MTLNDIMNLVADGYPDGGIINCWDFDTGAVFPDADKAGDTFALFIVREIRDTYDELADDFDQLDEAIRVTSQARRDLQDVVDSLRRNQDDLSSEGPGVLA